MPQKNIKTNNYTCLPCLATEVRKNIPSLVEARKHREDRGKIVADLVRKELGLGEEEANSFASSFFMPDVSFQKEWKKTSGLALVDRVMKIKRIFNVSYRAVLLAVRPA